MKKQIAALLLGLLTLSACTNSLLPPMETAPAAITTAAEISSAETTASPAPPPSEAIQTTAPETTREPETAPPETTTEPETTAPPETIAVLEAETTTVPPETEAPAPPPLDLVRTIFLTFDDGPSRGKTEEILRILAEYDIRATFFTVGMFVDFYPQVLRQVAEAGHLIGCHSYSHDYPKVYASADSVREEISAWEQAVTRALGELPPTRLFRFPGGTTCYSLSQDETYFAILDAVLATGYTPFDWTVATNDLYLADKREDQTMEEYFFASLDFTLSLTNRTPAPPKILLVHDTSADTVAALPAVLDYLIERGYTFATLDQLEEPYLMNKKQPPNPAQIPS